MGRRKSKRKPQGARKRDPLDKIFTCPFCNHEKACDVKMERDKKTAHIICGVCSEDFQTVINNLTEPIDVYNEWIDACESVNN